MATVNSTLLQSKLRSSSAIEKRVRAVARTVRFVGGYHGDVHVLKLGKLIDAAGLAMAHAGESHAGGEGVPHVVALHREKGKSSARNSIHGGPKVLQGSQMEGVQTCRVGMAAAGGPPHVPRQDLVQRLEAVLRLVRALAPPELGVELLRDGDRVGRVEGDHRDRDARVEHLVRGEGVAEEVELGGRVGGGGGEQVARGPDGAAGDVDALHVPPQVRARHEEEREVGVRAEEYHRGRAGGECVRHHPLRRGLPERAVPTGTLREEAPPDAGVGVDVQPPAAPRRDGLPVPAASGRRHSLRTREQYNAR